MKRILLLIAVYQRPDITRICYKGVKRIESQFFARGYNLLPFIAYSESVHGEMAREFGFFSKYADNTYLGKKLNIGLAEAMEMPWDYLMQLGSDDLMTDKGVEAICNALDEGKDYFGFSQIYFVDRATMRMKYRDFKQVFGAGRVISRDILEKAAICKQVQQMKGEVGPNWARPKGGIFYVAQESPNQAVLRERVVHLWTDTKQAGLDGDSEERIMHNTKRLPTILQLEEPAIIDIKTGTTNIHSFESVGGKRVIYQILTPEMWELNRVAY